MNDKISVLIVEDSEDDALLIIRQFKKNNYDIISKRVETASQMQTALEDVSWDLVISDYNLPEFDGPSALTVLQKSGLDIPFIVVSGAIGEETAVVLMKAGAHDCIMKDNLARLIPVVNRELSEAQTRRERQQGEKQLKESEEQFRSIFENSVDAILLTVPDGTILAANSAACRMFGRSEEELCRIGRDGIVDYSDDRFFDATEERVRTNTYAEKEYFHIRKDGTIFPSEVSSGVFTDKDGNKRIIVIIRDITERKRAVENIRKAAQEWRTTFDSIKDMIMILDRDYRIVRVNEAVTSFLHRSYDEVLGSYCFDLIHLAKQCPKECPFRKMLNTKKHEESETFIDDKMMWISTSVDPIFDNDGGITGAVHIVKNITARKKAEESLRESEERYRVAIENSNDGIAIARNGKHLFANSKFLEIFGYDQFEDILKTEEYATVHPDDRERVTEINQRRMRGEPAPARYEFKGIKKDGTPVDIEASVAPIIYLESTASLIYFRDITEQKRAEEALLNNQKELQTIMDAAPVAVSWSDAETNEIEYLNRKFIELFGYTREDIPTMSAWRRLAYQDPTESKEFVSLIPAAVDAYTQGKSAPAIERMVTCKDGSIRFIELKGVIAANKLVVIFTDLTEQKRAEESLRESENKFRDLVEKSIVGVYLIQDGLFRYVNARFAEIHGYTIEEMIDKMGISETIVQEDLSKVNDNIHKRLMGKIESSHLEFRILTKQEEIRNVEVYACYTMYRGKPAIIGTLVDISEQKRAEESLRESENKFRDLVEKSPVGVYLIQDGLFRYINARYAEIHGYTIEELVDKKGTSDTVLSEDMPKVRDDFRKGLKGDIGSLNTEFKIITKQREIKDVEVYGTYTTYRGKLAIIGTLVDITERKHADEMLKDLLKDLEKNNIELAKTYDELRESQQKIIQQEKMASIGQLAAGVAHEINNPVGFVMSNINSMGRYSERLAQFIKIQSEAIERLSKQEGDAAAVLDDLRKTRRALKIDYVENDFINVVKESLEGAERVKRIVRDLKNFSHKDEDEHKPGDINEGIESTINVVWNELKYKANMKKEYGKIPLTKCNLGQLNQVFMNILINAVQAIEERGEISVKTEHRGGDIVISISDTGSGIQEDKINRIFEPFFTTKEVGKGTGLGLSIAYDIVKKHNGEIMVASEIGKGTTFTVTLPIVER